ncbi:hypothetical protein [Kitasatospora sp. NPDC097643]
MDAVDGSANPASRAVLERTGFTATGPTVVGGRPGLAFRLDLRAYGD